MDCDETSIVGFIDTVVDDYSSMGLDTIWRVSPFDQPPSLEEVLKDKGFVKTSEGKVMTTELTNEVVGDLPGTNEDSDPMIKFVPSEDMNVYIDVCIKGYGFPEAYCDSVEYFLSNVSKQDKFGDTFYNYIAFIC